MATEYFLDWDANTFAKHTAKLFLGGFAMAYVFYCVQSDGPMFLPTLSTTWDYEPGNFISRWVIGVGAVAMHTITYVIFFGDEDDVPDSSANTKRLLKNSVLLRIGQLAVLLLSVVGAVCSADSLPECRGNSTVHYAAAISFFVLYDLYMLVLVREFGDAPFQKRFHQLLVLLSSVSKVRFFRQYIFSGDFPVLAVFEWLDVACIIYFTASYAALSGRNYHVQLLERKNGTEDKDENVKWKMNGNLTLHIALRYAFGTLITCLVVSILLQTVDPGIVPMISDTFVYPPTNYISRWAGIIGTTYLSLAHVAFYFAYRSSLKQSVAKGLFLLSLVGGVGLSWVMVVSETENHFWHMAAARTFFILYDVFMVAFVAAMVCTRATTQTVRQENQWHLVRMGLFAIISTCITISKFYTHKKPAWLRDIEAELEWTNALVILLFLVQMPAVLHGDLERIQYVIAQKPATASSYQKLI